MKKYKLYSFAKILIKPLLFILYRPRFIGREKIPREGKLILASNHISNLDPVFQCAGIKRVLYFMAKIELFKNPVFGWILRHLHAFPVHRGAGDSGAINYAEKIIESGDILAIYPEGTRSKTGVPMRGKAGVAMLAYSGKCDVLPVSVYCDGKVRLFKKYTVRIGDVIPYESLGIKEGKPSEFKSAANMVMEKITELWSEKHCK